MLVKPAALVLKAAGAAVPAALPSLSNPVGSMLVKPAALALKAAGAAVPAALPSQSMVTQQVGLFSGSFKTDNNANWLEHKEWRTLCRTPLPSQY